MAKPALFVPQGLQHPTVNPQPRSCPCPWGHGIQVGQAEAQDVVSKSGQAAEGWQEKSRSHKGTEHVAEPSGLIFCTWLRVVALTAWVQPAWNQPSLNMLVFAIQTNLLG